jgi:hypothetical protein
MLNRKELRNTNCNMQTGKTLVGNSEKRHFSTNLAKVKTYEIRVIAMEQNDIHEDITSR